MEQAQADREVALKDKEETVRKLSRRTTLGLGATGGLAVASAGLAYWGTSAERRFNAAQKEARLAAQRTKEDIINRDALRTDLRGVLRVSAAAPGELAYENDDGSDFSRLLSNYAIQDDVAFEDAINRTRDEILEATFARQTVYVETYLNSRIYLARRPEGQMRKAIIWAGTEYESDFLNPLKATTRDGERWASALDAVGFDVNYTVNPSLDDMVAETIELREALQTAEVGEPVVGVPVQEGLTRAKGLVPIQAKTTTHNALSVIVFSGHAFQLDGLQYLAARDSVADTQESLKSSSVSLMQMLALLDDMPGASVLALDACRNNLGYAPTR